MSYNNKKFLLNLAQKSIGAYFDNKKLEIKKEEIPQEFQKQGAVFVTLTLNNELRGCIGRLEAIQSLYKDVMENAAAAAFFDPRFAPLSQEEFKRVKIEISILSEPEEFKYTQVGELIKFLNGNKPGLIIQKGMRRATFLPQVWEDLKTPEEFLSHLCLKAGLPENEWQNGDLKINFYKVEKIFNGD